MLVVFGLIAVLFVIGYVLVRRDQNKAQKDQNDLILKQECEDREFERREAKAASLVALQKTADEIREQRAARAAEIEAAGLVPAVPPTGTPERRKPLHPSKKKGKKGRK